MIRNPGGLRPEVLELATQHVHRVSELRPDITLLVYCTYRSAREQAEVYGRGRTAERVSTQIDHLRKTGYPASADMLQKFCIPKPSSGPIATNASPWFSFHQWGLAYDCVPLVNGKPLWSEKESPVEWGLVGQVGVSLGLQWAGSWKTFRELPHFQFVPSGFVLDDEAKDPIWYPKV